MLIKIPRFLILFGSACLQDHAQSIQQPNCNIRQQCLDCKLQRFSQGWLVGFGLHIALAKYEQIDGMSRKEIFIKLKLKSDYVQAFDPESSFLDVVYAMCMITKNLGS